MSPRTHHDRTRRSITVVVVDDHPLFRGSLERRIAADPSLTLRGSAASATTAVPVIRDGAPDVVVVDSRLRSAVTAALSEGPSPVPPLLLLAESGDAAEVYGALAAGARGYLSKASSGDVIVRAIVRVHRGDVVLDPGAQLAMATEAGLRTRVDRPLLSPREGEVLRFIAEGLFAPAMARELHLSPATIKTHAQHLYGKLGVNERGAAVATAMRRGLLE